MSRFAAAFTLIACFVPCCTVPLLADDPITEPYDYADSMREVAKAFTGREGVVIHIGDSITHANPYGQWARFGKGRTDEDLALLKWMHLDANDDSDGWWLAREDLPGGHSYTGAGGLQMGQSLAGKGEFPGLEKMLELYQPQIAVLMLGTNDVSAGREVEEYRCDAEQVVHTILATGCICILSTIPPHVGDCERSAEFNKELRQLAADRQLPLIDFEQEILKRRPCDWNGTLMNQDDPHPSAERGEIKASSEPTPENLRESGYLLRGWLSVRKIGEVKKKVLD